MKKTVCTIIVTYNRVQVLKTALAHVLNQSVPPDLIIVVDNDSSDGTKEFIRSADNGTNIRGLYLNNNIGYAGGIAHGMRYGMALADYDYYWVMDDDTYYAAATLQELLAHMEGSSYDILGLTGAVIRMGTKMKPVSGEKLQDVDYVMIDGALIRTGVIQEIGVPDEKYFMMCEDQEYCKRMKKHGFTIGLLNIGNIERLTLGGGGGFTKGTLWRGYYQSRNHVLILKKYFSLADLFGNVVHELRSMVVAALYAPDRLKRVRFRLTGIWHGLLGVGGKTLDPGTLKFIKKK